MLKFHHIFKSYERPLFEDFNLEIKENEITCILGPSGVGKTTLLRMLAGLTDYQGQIEGLQKVSYVFQENRLIPALTVYENLHLTCPSATLDEIKEMLSKLGVEDKLNSYPSALSGGEAKRISMARAFLYDAPILLMDEAFTSLDIGLKYELITSFSKLWLSNKKTVIFVTHDVDEALLLGNRILILKNKFIQASYEITDPLPRNLKSQEIRALILEQLISID